MELRVLGPLEIRHDGLPIALRGVKPRQLLALLALRPNRSVATEQLTDELWEGDPPPSAAAALRVHVARLRGVLEPERDVNAPSSRIPAGPHGYLLRVEPDELDAQRFEHLVVQGCASIADGDLVAAVARLAEALELWRGPALADVADLSAARAERARLDELRASAFEELAETRLALGDHVSVVDLLRGASEEFPLRERFTAQLMRALYRGGRQAEALRAYAEQARRLDETLGVGPSPALRSLEEDVLLQRPALDWVPPPPSSNATAIARRRSGRARFIDRRVELATLLESLDRVADGERRLVLVGGQEGIGKTTLVEEFAARATERGVPVVFGRCQPDPIGGYRPMVEIVRGLLDRLDADGEIPVELGLLLPDRAGAGLPRPADPGQGTAPERYRLYEAVATVVDRAVDGPLVLVVEDAHWADRPTFAVLRHLLRHRRLEGLLVVATYRDDEIRGDNAELLDALAPPAATERLHVVGFGHNEVRALLRAVAAPEAMHSLVELAPTVHEVTSGNPLFIRELMRALDEEQGRFDDVAELERTITTIAPAGVRALVERRMDRLCERSRDAIRIAALLGMEISTDALAAACDVGDDDLVDALEECLTARLLVEHDEHLGHFVFPHAIVRNAVYAQTPAERRVHLHRQVGEALERMPLAGSARRPAELAHHFVAAASVAELVPKAAMYAAQAGREAAERFAFGEAVRWFEESVRLGAECCGDVAGLWFGLALAYEGHGQLARAKDAFLTSARLSREAGNRALLADVAVAAAGPWSSGFASQAAVVELLDEALDALGESDGPRRARVLNSLAAALYYVDPDREGRIAREALELGRALDDDLAVAGSRLALHRWSTHRPEARRDRLALSGAVASSTVDTPGRELHLRARRLHLSDLLENAMTAEFDVGLDEYERAATEQRSPYDMYWAAVLRATQATLRGDLVAGEQLARGAELRGQELAPAAGAHMLQRFAVRYQQGRLAEMSPDLRHIADEMPAYRAGAALFAMSAAETGRLDDAVRIARRALGPDGSDLPRDVFWVAAVALFAGAVADAGDVELRHVLTELLHPCADHVVVFGVGGAVFGTGHHWLGVLARASGDLEAAVEHLSRAVDLSDRIGAPYWVAHARLDLADALACRDGDADSSTVEALTAAALAAARAGGYDRIVRRAVAAR